MSGMSFAARMATVGGNPMRGFVFTASAGGGGVEARSGGGRGQGRGNGAGRGGEGQGRGRGGRGQGGRGAGRGRGGGNRRRSNSRDPTPQKKVDTRIPDNPSVAIIGGGISGLVCASCLSDKGIHATVFDTGKNAVGGRLATRYLGPKEDAVFDHAAQYFTVSDPLFAELVSEWQEDGAVVPWKGEVGTLDAGGNFAPQESQQTRYVGKGGMRTLCTYIANKSKGKGTGAAVMGDCWVSKMALEDSKWRLWKNDYELGKYDIVLIAHNGKCANQLLVPSGAPLVAQQMMRLKLSSIWALMAAFEQPLNLPFEGAFVADSGVLSWAGNNSKRINDSSGPECWTFFSTGAYGRANKCPQEAVPKSVSEKVTKDMLEEFQKKTGVTIPEPLFSRTQLWGAALPLNTPGVPFIFDAEARVGMIGDWLMGSSIQDACMSGISMADHLVKFCDQGGEAEGMSLGLKTPLKMIEGAQDIGSFPEAVIASNVAAALKAKPQLPA